MARGSKDYDKVVRKVNKGAKSKAKINSIQKMVEAMINGDVEAAEEELSEYIRTTSREILLGEAADEDESEDKMTDDKDETESDDSDDSEESADDKESEDDKESDEDESEDKESDKESDDDSDDSESSSKD